VTVSGTCYKPWGFSKPSGFDAEIFQIDQMVYKFCDLTDEEIKIVEGETQ